MAIDLEDFEDRAKHQLQGPCTGMAHEVLELIAEIRHLRGERDCLAKVLASVSIRGILHPSGGFAPECDYDAPYHRCFQCWLKSAQETTTEFLQKQ